jgi:hypothetical protein
MSPEERLSVLGAPRSLGASVREDLRIAARWMIFVDHLGILMQSSLKSPTSVGRQSP